MSSTHEQTEPNNPGESNAGSNMTNEVSISTTPVQESQPVQQAETAQISTDILQGNVVAPGPSTQQQDLQQTNTSHPPNEAHVLPARERGRRLAQNLLRQRVQANPTRPIRDIIHELYKQADARRGESLTGFDTGVMEEIFRWRTHGFGEAEFREMFQGRP